MTKIKIPPVKLILITLTLSLSGSWHFGYQLTVINPSEFVFKQFFNHSFKHSYGRYLNKSESDFLWVVIVNLINIGCLISTMCSSVFLERLGRRKSFYITVTLCSIGPVLCGLSYTVNLWELFAVGRFVSGLGTGLAICVQPVYFTEISPDQFRGFLSTATGVLVEFGYSFGSVIALPALLGSDNMWPWLFWTTLLANILTVVLLPFLPESPKFLLASEDDEISCSKSLVYFKHENVSQAISQIKAEIEAEKESIGFRKLVSTPYLRKGLFLACLTQFAATFCGISVISYYSTRMFIQVGVNQGVAGYATVAMTLQCLFAAIINSFIIDRVGRRPLLIGSLCILGLADLLFSIFAYTNRRTGKIWSGYACITAVIIFSFVFGLGPSTIQWYVAAELMPQNARSSATLITMVIQWICFTSSGFIYNALEVIFLEWSFLLFVVCTFSSAGYLYFALPETGNKSQLDIIKKLGYIDDQADFQLENVSPLSR